MRYICFWKQPRALKMRNHRAGLTLLEVMIVLAIIALIVGLAGPRLMESFGRAKSQAAQIQMANLKSALQLFYIDVGRYPSEAESLEALIASPAGSKNWAGPYVDGDEALNDPWARRYLYRMPGVEAPFDLLTYGRDGRIGGSNEDSDISL